MLAATARALLLRRRSPPAAICSPLRSLSCSPATSSASSSSYSSTNGDTTEVLLLRDYISRRLTGYFSAPASSSPVGELASALAEKESDREPKTSIDFSSLSGKSSYEHALSGLYRALSVSWLTPSELFSPHYGRAVARFVAEDAKAKANMKPSSSSKKEEEEAKIKIRVVEVGAGRGTLAADFLDYLLEVEPALYRQTRYVSLEVSPSLARAQEEKVLLRSSRSGSSSSSSSSRGHGESYRFSSVVGDASDLGAWRRAAAEAFKDGEDGEDQHLYVLAFEVLDNLPHDRVVREEEEEPESREGTSEQRGSGWLQTLVEVEASPKGRPLRELLSPASDPLISLCLSASQRWQEGSGRGGSSGSIVARFFDALFSSAAGGGGGGGEGRGGTEEQPGSSSGSELVVFLPTGAASMISSLFEVAPDHSLLAADFDALPGVAVSGAYAPLVSSTHGGVARDYSSLYSPPVGEAVDIFFPTNFDALSDLYLECARRKRRGEREEGNEKQEEEGEEEEEEGGEEGEGEVSAARHCKQSSFLSLAADTAAFSRGAVSTASGWSPMLDDWNNSAVLVARSKKRKRKEEEVEGRENNELK